MSFSCYTAAAERYNVINLVNAFADDLFIVRKYVILLLFYRNLQEEKSWKISSSFDIAKKNLLECSDHIRRLKTKKKQQNANI